MQEKMIALVTGANQGLGKQVARELVAHGYTVLVGSRDLIKGQRAAEEIGAGAHAIQIDVTDAASVSAAAKRVTDEFGRLDVLVNNAGIAQSGRYASNEEIIAAGQPSTVAFDEIKALFDTNVFGVLAVTQAMLPLIRQSSAGRIVNVSSALGSMTLNADPAFPFRPAFGATYAASKTTLNAMTLALAIELESAGIKVRAVSPGFTNTAINFNQGTETVEVGASALVRAALDAESPTGSFTGPDGALPW